MAREDMETEYATYMFGASRIPHYQDYPAPSVNKVIFTNKAPSSYVDSWDLSYYSGDNEIISYVVPITIDGTQYYNQYIVSDMAIDARYCKGLFFAYASMTEIENIEYLNTSNATDMSYMFAACQSLTSLDLTSFDTSNVTDMTAMFVMLENLTNIDVSSFDTSNVENMALMFAGCMSLEELNVFNFNTSNVKNMGAMFTACQSLDAIFLTSFDTRALDGSIVEFNDVAISNVDMLFAGCINLAGIVLGENFTRMDGLQFIASCQNLNTIISHRKATTSADLVIPVTMEAFDQNTSTNIMRYVPNAEYFVVSNILESS